MLHNAVRRPQWLFHNCKSPKKIVHSEPLMFLKWHGEERIYNNYYILPVVLHTCSSVVSAHCTLQVCRTACVNTSSLRGGKNDTFCSFQNQIKLNLSEVTCGCCGTVWLYLIWMLSSCHFIFHLKSGWYITIAQCILFGRVYCARCMINTWLWVCFLWGCGELDRGQTSHSTSSSIVLQTVPASPAKRQPEETFSTLLVFSVLPPLHPQLSISPSHSALFVLPFLFTQSHYFCPLTISPSCLPVFAISLFPLSFSLCLSC